MGIFAKIELFAVPILLSNVNVLIFVHIYISLVPERSTPLTHVNDFDVDEYDAPSVNPIISKHVEEDIKMKSYVACVNVYSFVIELYETVKGVLLLNKSCKSKTE